MLNFNPAQERYVGGCGRISACDVLQQYSCSATFVSVVRPILNLSGGAVPQEPLSKHLFKPHSLKFYKHAEFKSDAFRPHLPGLVIFSFKHLFLHPDFQPALGKFIMSVFLPNASFATTARSKAAIFTYTQSYYGEIIEIQGKLSCNPEIYTRTGNVTTVPPTSEDLPPKRFTPLA